MGTLRLMPRMLDLRAVQRQTAASRSSRPSMSVQQSQGCFGNEPMPRTMSPLRTLAQAAILRVSMGHLPADEGEGLGLGFGRQVPQEAARVKKRRLRARKRAKEADPLLLPMAASQSTDAFLR